MNRLQEIEARKSEIAERKVQIRQLLEGEGECDVDALEKEVAELQAEEKALDEEASNISADDETAKAKAEEEARKKAEEEAEKRRAIAEELAKQGGARYLTKEGQEKMDKEKRNVFATPEYRSGWAKKLMGLDESKFTKEELRAVGDAITTTATTFVASDEDTQGINNGGLVIPTSVREELLKVIFKESPFLRDVRKMFVNANVDLPYLFASDDASWYSETECTENEGQEYKNLKLTGFDLAKNVVITWRMEAMSTEAFIQFIIDELRMKVGKALAHAVLYGTGVGQPTGAIYGVVAETDANPIELIKKTKAKLSDDDKIGAKAYLSDSVNDAIVFYQDNNGSYPYLAGLPRISSLAVEIDPFLTSGDIVIGNPMNYVLNEVEAIRLDKEKSVKCRKVVYGAFGVYDGKPKPNAFAKGQLISASL